jgi:chromosome segregation ATPase
MTMTLQTDNILSLRSMKAQLEVGLIYLKRRHSELQRELAVAESQEKRGGIHPAALSQLRSSVQDHAIQIERRNLEIKELEDRIQAIQARVERSGPQGLATEHDDVTGQISDVRKQILAALRDLAEPLRRYEALAARKSQLATEISARTGRNQAYVNYIEGALFRQSEFVDDVKYAVEAIRRQRVVA